LLLLLLRLLVVVLSATVSHLAACVTEVQRQHQLLEQETTKSLRHTATGNHNSNNRSVQTKSPKVVRVVSAGARDGQSNNQTE
jgi:hypothetical protein